MFVDEMSDTLEDDLTSFIQSALFENGLVWAVLDPIGDVAAQWVAIYAFELAQGLNETTRNRLREVMLQNLENGKGVDSLRDAVSDVIEEATDYRAMMIARTETTYAMNYGNLIAYKGAGRSKKTWLTDQDERVCKECGDLDGETVDINESFSNGKMCPPAHPHCRCTMISEE
ncbi:head protein [Bacillus manliponensis]|uniref:Head protein n=1 Tax=Bacillus manliponensis TaxID=574376 RepID=A0A073JS94_9BACI|nr:head protein [Bacillus manliponensis]